MDCDVCWELFHPTNILIFKCTHKMCKWCFYMWRQRSDTCHMCRQRSLPPLPRRPPPPKIPPPPRIAWAKIPPPPPPPISERQNTPPPPPRSRRGPIFGIPSSTIRTVVTNPVYESSHERHRYRSSPWCCFMWRTSINEVIL